jgi:hypothetical protein
VIVGISNHAGKSRRIFSIADDGQTILKEADNVNAYLGRVAKIAPRIPFPLNV